MPVHFSRTMRLLKKVLFWMRSSGPRRGGVYDATRCTGPESRMLEPEHSATVVLIVAAKCRFKVSGYRECEDNSLGSHRTRLQSGAVVSSNLPRGPHQKRNLKAVLHTLEKLFFLSWESSVGCGRCGTLNTYVVQANPISLSSAPALWQ
ncbi:phenylalanyl-trna synthetase [Moniliophthora roreri]|nr:phenylalanyl-trna synthetase [Moniliophthora roreri]